MQAIILAGGFGTRLKAHVPHVPKPMAAVNDEPFLGTLLRYGFSQGLRDAVLCLHHQAEIIQDYFGDCFAGVNITYSIEQNPLGTGGAIKQALRLLNTKEPIFAMNGDSLVMLNYANMMAQHIQSGAKLTLASMTTPSTERYSRLRVEDGRLVHYEVTGDAAPGQVSVGFYVLEPDVFTSCKLPETFSFERDFMAVHTPHLKPAIYDEVEYFIDIGVPDDYARAQTEIPQMLAA